MLLEWLALAFNKSSWAIFLKYQESKFDYTQLKSHGLLLFVCKELDVLRIKADCRRIW
jgi:hypothetical protein